MKELISEIETSAGNELARAQKKFGTYNRSSHESYAVLLEEIEESKDEMGDVHEWLHDYWIAVKKNDVERQKESLARLAGILSLCAAECVQSAAMCRKALLSIEAQEKPEQSGESEVRDE